MKTYLSPNKSLNDRLFEFAMRFKSIVRFIAFVCIDGYDIRYAWSRTLLCEHVEINIVYACEEEDRKSV